MNFFDQANLHLKDLNINEKKLFEYVVRNTQTVKDMSIRTFSNNCFVSTTTVLRFVKKLGYDGYKQFTDALKLTTTSSTDIHVPSMVLNRDYNNEYLSNIVESVRVLSPDITQQFSDVVNK